MDALLFGTAAQEGVVLTSGGGETVLVWQKDCWRRTGNPWRILRELPMPLRIDGVSLRIYDECDEAEAVTSDVQEPLMTGLVVPAQRPVVPPGREVVSGS